MWQCKQCNKANNDDWSVCWNCVTPKNTIENLTNAVRHIDTRGFIPATVCFECLGSLHADLLFCDVCGTGVTKQCPNCKEHLYNKATFCGYCSFHTPAH
jgi:hypothetical protein